MRFNNIVTSPCKERNWAYINFLQVGKHIVMPSFNIEEDNTAYQYVKNAFSDCHIHLLEMAEIAKEGGALHCISLLQAMKDDETPTAVVQSRQLHIYRNEKKILILAGKALPKVILEDKLNELITI